MVDVVPAYDDSLNVIIVHEVRSSRPSAAVPLL